MNDCHRNPTLAELAVLERATRAARGEFPDFNGEQALTKSFWKNAAASMRPEVQGLYAAEFEAMERYEPLLDAAIGAGRYARRALGTSCRAAAHWLRAAARSLDSAGRRLSLSR